MLEPAANDLDNQRTYVIDKIAQLCQLSGCDRFIVQCDYGGQPWPIVREGLERYAAEVLPVVAKL